MNEQPTRDFMEESIGAEVRRLWESEIKPYFNAEEGFLRSCGEESGYDRNYIGRIMDDHRLMEELVWGEGAESMDRFAKVLAAHIRYKEEFFIKRVGRIVEPEDLPAEERSMDRPKPGD